MAATGSASVMRTFVLPIYSINPMDIQVASRTYMVKGFLMKCPRGSLGSTLLSHAWTWQSAFANLLASKLLLKGVDLHVVVLCLKCTCSTGIPVRVCPLYL
eukprot:355066-Chlamydomonas_euryale.AAC.14